MASKALTITSLSDCEVAMTRGFAAPRERVFDALTRPELLARWYGPDGWSLVVCEIDLRVGGAWRFVTRKPSGREVEQQGVYREIVRPERIVQTGSWTDWDVGEVLVTTRLDERAGHTTLTTITRYPSSEIRDALAATGANDHADEHFNRLESLLAERPWTSEG
jgi:uncharacterized protein YndB with AHSA1/START domain